MMTSRARPILLSMTLLALMFFLGGCSPVWHGQQAQARIPGLAEAGQVYTLTNLHPDEPRHFLWAANFVRGGLIPVCSPVTIVKMSPKSAWFRLESTGVVYRYYNHRTNPRPLQEHLSLVLGPECPQAELASMSETDKRHIANGTLGLGMSRKGVIVALGYPTEKHTPDLKADTWKYWRSRARSFDVTFGSDGLVTAGEIPQL